MRIVFDLQYIRIQDTIKMSPHCRMSAPGAVHQTVPQPGERAGVRRVRDDAGGARDAGHRLQASDVTNSEQWRI